MVRHNHRLLSPFAHIVKTIHSSFQFILRILPEEAHNVGRHTVSGQSYDHSFEQIHEIADAMVFAHCATLPAPARISEVGAEAHVAT